MIDYTRDPVVTEALKQWRGRVVWPTDFSSADLQGLSAQLRQRAVFSARTTNADYLAEVQHIVDEMLSGKINMAEGRYQLMRKLKELGYDPEKGFPQDMAKVPRAERDSLQDLGSEKRLDLLLETNQRVAANYGRVVAGNTESARYAYPAWELVRLYLRRTPRGERRGKGGVLEADPDNAWPTRWAKAGETVEWQGAAKEVMVALKDSPIWLALGEGAGGYHDTLGHPFPPFAFRSGMAFKAVPRATVKELGLLEGKTTPQPVAVTLTPGEQEIAHAINRLSPELRARLEQRRLLAA